MQAFSSAVEVLRVARKLGATDLFSYSVCALENKPVAASNDIAIVPDLDVSDLPKNAVLVIVSGAGADKKTNPALIAKLRYWARQAHPIWAISSGVVRLAQAGLIDDCKVAAHWEDVPYLRENHPRVEVSTSLYVAEAMHATCSGGGAAADLMLGFIERHVTAGMVEDIASRLILDGVRDGRLKQSFPAQLRYSTANKTVFAAVQLMEANCFEALPLHEVARRVRVSQRQLERLFRAEFDQTPTAVYLALRLGEARQDVLAGRRTLIDIALDYGFQPGNFTKVYRRTFGVAPSEDRKKPAPLVS
jgi:transcriptional regulator GlxA family with amidase domain